MVNDWSVSLLNATYVAGVAQDGLMRLTLESLLYELSLVNCVESLKHIGSGTRSCDLFSC
jgi:hypothetical protein